MKTFGMTERGQYVSLCGKTGVLQTEYYCPYVVFKTMDSSATINILKIVKMS